MPMSFVQNHGAALLIAAHRANTCPKARTIRLRIEDLFILLAIVFSGGRAPPSATLTNDLVN